MASVRAYNSFDELPSGYDRLFERAGCFFSSRPWYRNFTATALEPHERPVLYGLEADDAARTPQALLPMKRSTTSGLIRGRKLSPLSSYYTPCFGPLLAGEQPAGPALRQLASAIVQDRPRWDVVELRPLAQDTALFADLIAALRSAKLLVQSYFCFGNWYLEVDGRTYAQYTESLPSKLRNTVRRKFRKLNKTGRMRLEIVTDVDALEAASEAYERVYQASWKVPEPHPSFMPGLMRTCAEQGALRLGLLYVDDEPAAAQAWIVSDGTASIYKLAYDDRFAKLSVGSILSTHLMEHALDVDRVDRVDYLSGDDAYKRDWMSHRRERWGLIAFNPRTAQGLIRAGRNFGGRAAKSLMRRVGRETS